MTDIKSIPNSPSDQTEHKVKFEDFGLSPDILRALTEQGYVHPTPIQAEARFTVVLQGRGGM
jgi:superfamily II DNA/RNA helicase